MNRLILFRKKVKIMELGNMFFGNSRGLFEFPDRDIVNSNEWETLCKKAQVDVGYGAPEVEREFYGFDNDVFTIRPYYWGEDEAEEELPNFVYKPIGFEIEWYKYAFRDSYMNFDLSKKQILEIFKKCAKSIK
jgi:hypothetical protein